MPYNGADGLPIREEILEERGTAVITRNSYGARCLNVPDVLIADIDLAPREPTGQVWIAAAVLGFVVSVALGLFSGRPLIALLACPAAVLLALRALEAIRRLRVRADGGAEAVARRRVEAFAQTAPDWRLHLYRTPAGFRVVVTHRRFDPTSPEVAAFFEALGVDPAFRRMCTLQRCFRARLTAKPWRIGVTSRLRPRPGVWPVRPKWLPARAQWVEAYEAKAKGFAACRFEASLGQGPDDAEAAALRAWHDTMCGAHENLPLA